VPEEPLEEGRQAVRVCASYCLDDSSREAFLLAADAALPEEIPIVLDQLDQLVRDELTKHFPDVEPPSDSDALRLWAARWTHRVRTWPGPRRGARVARSADWWRSAPPSPSPETHP
jgi:hypothetical protein